MILHLSNASDSLWNTSAQTHLRRRGWCSCFAPCTQTESCETPHAAPKTILFGIKLCGFRFWQAGFYSKVYTLAYQFRNVHAVYKRPLYPQTFRPGIVGDDIASWIHGKAPAKNTSSKRCICLSCCFALALNKKKKTKMSSPVYCSNTKQVPRNSKQRGHGKLPICTRLCFIVAGKEVNVMFVLHTYL